MILSVELVALIAPVYRKRHRHRSGRAAMAIETMLQIYFLHHWLDLSDAAAEDALYDGEANLRFRHLLEQRRLTEQIFAAGRGQLEARGSCSRRGRLQINTQIPEVD